MTSGANKIILLTKNTHNHPNLRNKFKVISVLFPKDVEVGKDKAWNEKTSSPMRYKARVPTQRQGRVFFFFSIMSPFMLHHRKSYRQLHSTNLLPVKGETR